MLKTKRQVAQENHKQVVVMRQQPLIIGCCFTGARFMPNHTDPAVRATHMPLSSEDNIADAQRAYELGARHLHFHARNPQTGEQCADLEWYQQVRQGVRQSCPGGVVSFGSSRKGAEVLQAIVERGEYARSIGLEAEPDLFTNFAAVEINIFEEEWRRHRLDPLHPVNIRRHYRRVLSRMKSLGVAQEVEVTTHPKSLRVLEQIAAAPNLGLLQPLNVVILLGFSERLPLTRASYEEAVERASRLLQGRRGTITLGAVIRPHESHDLDPTDVLDWVLEDDRVSVFRTGIEDSPALRGVHKTNAELVAHAVEHVQKRGVSILTDPAQVRETMRLPLESPRQTATVG